MRPERRGVFVALSWEAGVALVVSVGAFVVAVISAVYVHRADGRAANAEKRAERAEHRDVARFDREQDEAESAHSARIVIRGSGSVRTIDNCRYALTIRNDGAPAYDIDVWLVDKDGNDVSRQHTGSFNLERDQSEERFGVLAAPDAQAENLCFAYRWSDGRGEHPDLITEIQPKN